MAFYGGSKLARTRAGLPIVCIALLALPLAGRTRPTPSLDAGYLPALATADHLLQAWQNGDLENGTVLLTGHVKQAVTSDAVEKFFSTAVPSAYEIGHGKLMKPGHYEFPVALIYADSKSHTRRRFSSIVVVNTGNNDWAVDKLP